MANKILVAGGTSGIGAAIVRKLAENGREVHVLSRNEPSDPVKDVTYYQTDVTEGNFGEISFESLEGLVYAPGSINLRPFSQLKPKDFTDDFAINVVGAVNLLKHVEKPLKKSGNASVILFSTVAVGQGMPYHSSTAASKGAVEGLARSLASEWAPGIRVNVIAPSITETPLAAQILKNEERTKMSADRHPLGRVGTPEDIASLAVFLLSNDASWITGQTLGVDGGMSSLRKL